MKGQPWSTITLIDGFPTKVYVDAQNRIGSVRFKILGKVPADLSMFISENHTAVTEANATWTCKNPSKSYTINPKDQCIQNAKKASDQDKKKFQLLYLVFQTALEDAEFSIQVTFPEEELLEQRHRKSNYGGADSDSSQPASHRYRDDSLLSLDDKEAQAEKNFYAIGDKQHLKNRVTFVNKKDFIIKNITVKSVKVDAAEALKIRQLKAKRRRDVQR